MIPAGRRIVPQRRKAISEGDPPWHAHHEERPGFIGLGHLSRNQSFLGSAQLEQSGFPPPIQFASHQPVVGIDAIELALGEGCLIAQPVNLLLLSVTSGFFGLQVGLARFG